MGQKTLYLVDGENLLLRFEESIKSGQIQAKGLIYSAGRYVWHPKITQQFLHDILRVSYYTTMVGDDSAINALTNDLHAILCRYTEFVERPNNSRQLIVPHVFKKEGRSTKTKSVDINITIDALRHANNRSVNSITLITGDGDYVPLVQELQRNGVNVTVMAFSNGLSEKLRQAPDDFLNLDEIFFASATSEKQKS